jgi:hypothetical protein
MKEELTQVFKDRVLKSAQEHIVEIDNITILNDVFSLKMGMNRDEIENILSSTMLKIDDELYALELSSEIEGINKLYFWIGREIGLYSVFAMNEKIECDGFALNLKKQFYGYERILEVGYGRFTRKESQLKDLSKSYNSWLLSLEKGEILMETAFNKESGATLKNDLKQILIGASKDEGEMPSIVIVYKFSNAK